MNSIGVHRSVAVCVSLLALTIGPSMRAADCAPNTLSPQAANRRLEELGKSAQVEMAQRRFADASRHLKEATCLAPNDARIFYSLGSAQAVRRLSLGTQIAGNGGSASTGQSPSLGDARTSECIDE